MDTLFISLRKSTDKQFYFTIEKRYKTIATSEMYTRRYNAYKSANRLVDAIRKMGKVELVDQTGLSVSMAKAQRFPKKQKK